MEMDGKSAAKKKASLPGKRGFVEIESRESSG